MTIGTIIRDDRYSVTTSCGLDVRAGNYFTKTWSGQDDPINHLNENNYTMHLEATSNPQCTYRVKGSNDPWLSGTYESCGFGVVPPLDFAVLTENETIKLLLKLDSEIRGHNFNASVALGESKEAMQMVATRTSQLYHALRGAKSGNFSAVAKALGVRSRSRSGKLSKTTVVDPGHVWLEYEFGWRPLIHDLEDGANAFFALTNKPLSRTYKASKKKVIDLTETASSSVITGEAVTIRALRAVITEDYSPWYSLGLTDASSVVWELMPYSFVVDWFIPFGNYLQARAALHGFKNAVISETVKSTLTKKRLHFETPYWSYDIIGNGASVRIVNVTRRPNVQLVVPRPGVKPWRSIVDVRHLADSVALLLNFKEDRPRMRIY